MICLLYVVSLNRWSMTLVWPSSRFWWSGQAVQASSSSTASSTGPWSLSLDPRTWTTRKKHTYTALIRIKHLQYLTLILYFFCLSVYLVSRSSSVGWDLTIRLQESSFIIKWRQWASVLVWITLRNWNLPRRVRNFVCPPWTWNCSVSPRRRVSDNVWTCLTQEKTRNMQIHKCKVSRSTNNFD